MDVSFLHSLDLERVIWSSAMQILCRQQCIHLRVVDSIFWCFWSVFHCLLGVFPIGASRNNTTQGKGYFRVILFKLRCSNKTTDVIFVLDGSESVKQAGFKDAKKWVINVSHLLLLNDNRTQIGVVQYSHWQKEHDGIANVKDRYARQDFMRTEVELALVNDLAEFDENVNEIDLMGYTTNTAHALNKTVFDFQSSKRYMNEDNQKVVILLTDGKATDAEELQPTAEYLKSLDILIIAVGIADAQRSELMIITDNQEDHIYQVNDYDSLKGIRDELFRKVVSLSLEGSNNSSEHKMEHQFNEIGISSKRSHVSQSLTGLIKKIISNKL